MNRAPATWPALTLPLTPPYPPMEAESADRLPVGAVQYEPKWDGFRCIAFRDGDEIALQSKAGQPLGRYFPEIVEALRGLGAKRFVLDGELAIPHGESFSFDALLQRIHPAQSRIRRLADETPAIYVVFDLLVDDAGRPLVDLPLAKRRPQLERFASRWFGDRVRLSPATTDPALARAWLVEHTGLVLDGVVAKELELPYRSGERDGMVKVKRLRTADCVVGGFRWSQKGGELGSILLGLYDDDGQLHHVGFSSSFRGAERRAIEHLVAPLATTSSFTGTMPGGPSRWSRDRSTEWVPVKPKLVCEVRYDHFSGGRFRHGTKFLRWRPDKSPHQCTFDQVRRRGPSAPLAPLHA